MTDLRARIAAAIMDTCHGAYVDDAINAADAVIHELNSDGLRCRKCDKPLEANDANIIEKRPKITGP